eukprot:gene14724-10533_t
MLDAISRVVDPDRRFAMYRVPWRKSETISRSLLALRKMNLEIDALPVMQKNITLDLIDKGVRFHVEEARRRADIFSFTTLLHCTARLGIRWNMLLPSTQEAIQELIEFYGSRRLKSHQQASMLLKGLGEMRFPLKTVANSQQLVVYRWSFDTIDKVISYMEPTHTRPSSPAPSSSSSSSSSQGATGSPRCDVFSQANTQGTTPELISQSIAGVIFGLKKMGVNKSDLSSDQRKLIVDGLGITCKHMDDELLCQSLHNVGVMDMEWAQFAKAQQTALLDTFFTQTLERATLPEVCALFDGLANIGVDLYDIARAQGRVDVVDRCVQRVLAVDAHVQGGAHVVKSRTFARLLRALGALKFCWTDFSIRTQQVLLGSFRLSFDFFTPHDLVAAIRGMSLMSVPLPVVQSPELFTSMMMAIERAHRGLRDYDVVGLVVGLGHMHVSWSMVPAGVREQWVHILRLGHGRLAPTNARTLTRRRPFSSLPPTMEAAAAAAAAADETDDRFHHRDDDVFFRERDREAAAVFGQPSPSSPSSSSAQSAVYNLASTPHGGILPHLLSGLGLMQASWASLEPPLRHFILDSLYHAPPVDARFPWDVAHIVWGLGRMGVRWPIDLQYAPPPSFSSSFSSLASSSSSSSLTKKDQIPVALLIACRSALHRSQMIDLVMTIHGFSTLGVSWDELATTTGGFHHRLLHRVAQMSNWASTTNVVNLMHDFACLAFDSDWRFLVDKPTTAATAAAATTTTTMTKKDSTPTGLAHSPSLLETFGILLCVMHHNRRLSALSPSTLEKYHQTIAYLATLPITDQWTRPSFVEAIASLAHTASTKSPLPASASLLAPPGHRNSSGSSGSGSGDPSIPTLPSPISVLTSQVADVLRESLGPVLRDAGVSVHEGWTIPAPEAASQRQTLPFAPAFTTTDIVLRRPAAATSTSTANDPRDIVAIVEIDDQRVPCVVRADHDPAADRDDARYRSFLSDDDFLRDVGVELEPRFAPLGPPPRPMAGGRPHRLKRHLYRQYLPHVPVVLVEVRGPLVVVGLEAGEASYLDTFDREGPLTVERTSPEDAASEVPYDPRLYVARAALRHDGEQGVRVASWAAKRSHASAEKASDVSIAATMENLRQSPAVQQAAAQIREAILAASASPSPPSSPRASKKKKTTSPPPPPRPPGN